MLVIFAQIFDIYWIRIQQLQLMVIHSDSDPKPLAAGNIRGFHRCFLSPNFMKTYRYLLLYFPSRALYFAEKEKEACTHA